MSVLVLVGLGLSACGEGLYAVRRDQGWEQPQPATSPQARSTPAAPDDQSAYTPSPPNPTIGDGAPIAAGSGGYYAQRGDTLYSIARRSGVPVRTIIDTNQLQPPYQLLIGQHLILPQTNTYVVVAGDTLYSISRRMHVGTSELTQANQLQPPYAVHTGQVLVIPDEGSAGGPTGTPVITSTAPVGGQGPLPPNDGSSIQVTPLAAPPGVPSSNLPGAPLGTAPPQPVTPPPPPDQPPPPVSRPPASSGPAFYTDPQAQRPDTTVLPPPTAPAPVPPPVPTPAVTTPTPNATTPLPSATAVPAAPSPAETQTASAAPPVLSELASPPARGGKKFLWPVKGRVVGTFGEQAKGLHNDGINVVAPKGTVVHAAENGVVAYAGNELRGFGNLLLIRHADGFMTAYAHNDELLVQRGDTVTRGQAIAKVGATGSVTEPQLHFEVRKGGQPVDPEQYLTPPGDS
jgi:murein DD-endopeptidase MepM/ murein hydrolase activator NlpD